MAVVSVAMFGQQPGPAGGPPPRGIVHGPPGRWWMNPKVAHHLGISPEQQKKMNAVFEQSRMQLIDLSAALQKEELLLEPMLSADPLDEAKVMAQVERVAHGRAELEIARSKMLVGLRKLLTAEQWRQLEADDPGPGNPQGRP